MTTTTKTYAIEFRDAEQTQWTRIAPARRYTGTREEMEALLTGQLARPPFDLPGTEYRMVEAS